MPDPREFLYRLIQVSALAFLIIVWAVGMLIASTEPLYIPHADGRPAEVSR